MIRKQLCLLAAAFLLCAASAHAQFLVYGDVTLDRITSITSSPILNTLSPPPCTGTTTTGCTSYRDDINPIGFTGGISYDFKTFGPVRLGADVRGVLANSKQGSQSNAQGSGTHNYSILGGVKGTFATRYSFLAPYVEGAIGYGRSNYGVLTDAVHNGSSYPGSPTYPGSATQGNIEYHAFAGVDLHALPWLDWRVFEGGVGVLQATGTYAHSYPVYNISSGVVLHMPR
jgi:hypothetical protein